LHIHGNGPEGEHREVERQGEDGVEDVHEPECDFDQVEECAEDADDEVVLCVAVMLISYFVPRTGKTAFFKLCLNCALSFLVLVFRAHAFQPILQISNSAGAQSSSQKSNGTKRLTNYSTPLVSSQADNWHRHTAPSWDHC
jgi:hypothetical protein